MVDWTINRTAARLRRDHAAAQEAGRAVWNRDAPLAGTPDSYRGERKGIPCQQAAESVDNRQRIRADPAVAETKRDGLILGSTLAVSEEEEHAAEGDVRPGTLV